MNRRFSFLALGLAGISCFLAPQIGGTATQKIGPVHGPFSPPGGTWAPLTHQPPNSSTNWFTSSEIFLMTDGTVLCTAADTSYNSSTNTYFSDPSVWKLTPDNTGSYTNGTWSQVASMNHSRLYYGSSVLADGRLIVSGGEYADGSTAPGGAGAVWTNESEIYDPVANTWTVISAPTGWNNVGDAPGIVLPNGKFLMGSDFDTRTAIFDPTTNTWTAAANLPAADLNSDEEAWALLPNNQLMTVSCFHHPDTKTYDYVTNSWTDTGNTPVDLVDSSSLELGPSMLMPNGTLFQVGGTPFTAIYTPSTNSWAQGPAVPIYNGQSLCSADAPAAMEPNGTVLVSMGPYSAGSFVGQTNFAEYNGTTMTVIPTPTIAAASYPFEGRFLVLPTGQILFTCSGNSDASGNTVYIYTPTGTYQGAWQPTITSAPAYVGQGSANNVISGTQFNGINQGSSYGDDSTNFTNYPLVRIQNNATGHVFYCRTHNHSTMAVATGSATVSTQFDVPAGVETGLSSVYVVANGIPSAAQSIYVVPAGTVLPNGYSLFRGVLASGGLSSLFFADGSTLNVLTGFTLSPSEAPVQVVATGSSPTLTPTSLTFTVTAKMNTSGTSQTIQLYNYSTSAYETLDTRTISTSNQTVTVTPTGTLSRFVSATGAIQAKVSYKQTGFTTTARWESLIDLINWNIH